LDQVGELTVAQIANIDRHADIASMSVGWKNIKASDVAKYNRLIVPQVASPEFVPLVTENNGTDAPIEQRVLVWCGGG
jgi:hypothetical protein